MLTLRNLSTGKSPQSEIALTPALYLPLAEKRDLEIAVSGIKLGNVFCQRV